MENENPPAGKKKLLIATDSFLPRWDGISRFLLEITPWLTKKFDVTIIAPDFGDTLKGFENVDVVRFPVMKKKVADTHLAKVRPGLIKSLVKSSDIVWTQSLGPIGALSMIYAKRQKKPLISFVHSVEWKLFSKSMKHFRYISEFFFRKSLPFLYNKCTLIMVPFDGMIDILEQQGIDAKKDIIYLGIDDEKFRPPESKEQAKKAIGLDPNKLVIGYLGRFGNEKDLGTLYSAFRKLGDEFDNITLLLVGGHLKQNFDNMENVKVIGQVDDPLPYYQAMDIYVLPSLTETTSLTTMEAMCCGVPVVVTPVGYVEKYVDHKFNGFIFPAGNSERLALTLSNLLKNEQLRSEVGHAARKTISMKHSWRRTAEDILSVLGRF